MLGELLIIITGFIRWILNGFKNSLKYEIYGDKKTGIEKRSGNFIWGLITILIILIAVIIFG
jgi:hypothetical protein